MIGILFGVILLFMIFLYILILLLSSSRVEDDKMIVNIFKIAYFTYDEGEREKSRFKKIIAKIMLLFCFAIRKDRKLN
ncbi:hypothetical protein [Fusobacterium sp.]|uniref:hypothetical protein n=1 Tax=Fusobacterium sp. TaxID=68766 RepID=UPI00396CAA9F